MLECSGKSVKGLRTVTTNWKRIENMKIAKGNRMLAMAEGVAEAEAPTKALIGETKSATFSIKVTDDDDKVIFENEKAPFNYQEVASLAQVIQSEGGKLSDDQISFIAEAFAGDENGKAVKNVVDLYNSKLKAQAKANAYAKLMNQYKPLSEDDAAKVFERMVDNYVRLYKVSFEVAKAKLASLNPANA